MSGTTRGQDVLNCVVDALKLFNVPMEKIFSVTTDGAPAMTGKINGFTTLFKNHVRTRDDVIRYYCIIHPRKFGCTSLRSVRGRHERCNTGC